MTSPLELIGAYKQQIEELRPSMLYTPTELSFDLRLSKTQAAHFLIAINKLGAASFHLTLTIEEVGQ